MEKERSKPPRPKHRASVEQSRELSPPPIPPRLSDFSVNEPRDETKIAETPEQNNDEVVESKPDEESKENRLNASQEK